MTELRLQFDGAPEIYDRVRPTYPEQLFETLREAWGGKGHPDVVEIGPGTGQATGSLLARGARVMAVARLAPRWRRSCARSSRPRTG